MNGIEKQILTRIAASLLAEGYHLTVDYERGYDSEPENRDLIDMDKITEAAFAVDECWLMVDKQPNLEGNPADHFIFFVWGNGNEGRDCIADYSVALSEVLDPICEWIEEAELMLC